MRSLAFGNEGSKGTGVRVAPAPADLEVEAFDQLPPHVRRLIANAHYPLSCAELLAILRNEGEAVAERAVPHSVRTIHKGLQASRTALPIPLPGTLDPRAGKPGLQRIHGRRRS
jgi:hypothetical protein